MGVGGLGVGGYKKFKRNQSTPVSCLAILCCPCVKPHWRNCPKYHSVAFESRSPLPPLAPGSFLHKTKQLHVNRTLLWETISHTVYFSKAKLCRQIKKKERKKFNAAYTLKRIGFLWKYLYLIFLHLKKQTPPKKNDVYKIKIMQCAALLKFLCLHWGHLHHSLGWAHPSISLGLAWAGALTPAIWTRPESETSPLQTLHLSAILSGHSCVQDGRWCTMECKLCSGAEPSTAHTCPGTAKKYERSITHTQPGNFHRCKWPHY